MGQGTRADWIAVDWGTTSLRATAMTAAGPVDLGHSPRGMNAVRPDEFETALLDLLGQSGRLDQSGPLDVVACGMVGARQGWIEAPYRPVPCTPLGPGLIRAPARRPGLTVHIAPGLSQHTPPDVMRGEETQVAGFLSLHPGWDGILCLPGTHSKWVAVSAGEVTGFRTVMTGELFHLLKSQSVLRHSIAQGDDGTDPDQRHAAFLAAVDEAMLEPDQVIARLFSIRAGDLLGGPGGAAGPVLTGARLSGLLIGAELAATRGWWLGNRVGLVCSGPLAHSYADALARQGVTVQQAEILPATLAGLAAARSLI